MVGKQGAGWGARRPQPWQMAPWLLSVPWLWAGRGVQTHRTEPPLPDRRVLRRRRSDLPTTATALLQQSHHGGSLGTIADCRLLQQRAVRVDLVGDELMRHFIDLVRE